MNGFGTINMIKRLGIKMSALAVLLFTVSSSAMSQQITVTATLDSAMIFIGGQVDLKLEVSQPEGLILNFPMFTDTITKNIEIVEKGEVDSVKIENNRLLLTQLYRITSFDSGLHYIPPIQLEIIQQDAKNIAASNELSLMVINPFEDVDPEKGFMDIKKPMDAPFKFSEILGLIFLYGGIALALGLLVWLFIYLRKNRTVSGLPFTKPKPIEPAHVIALRELDKIKASKLWEHNKIKEFHTQVTDTIRNYIEHRYNQPAMEQTSHEIFQSLRTLDIGPKSMEQLRQVLELADLVKFAKFNPLPDENGISLMNAYFFVNQTKNEEVRSLEEAKADMRAKDAKTSEGTSLEKN